MTTYERQQIGTIRAKYAAYAAEDEVVGNTGMAEWERGWVAALDSILQAAGYWEATERMHATLSACAC